jgi:RNA polymerase sigma-70 factor (ECF subfamily)
VEKTDNRNLLGEDFEAVYEMYFDTVYRICFIYFRGNKADTEDAVHTVFLKYFERSPNFDSEEHRKAWLIVTAQNVCKSVLRLARRKNLSLDEANNKSEDFFYSEVLDAVMRLPYKEKTAVYLCYYEDMTAAQAAEIMGCKENTVYSYLHRAKKKLQKSLGE